MSKRYLLSSAVVLLGLSVGIAQGDLGWVFDATSAHAASAGLSGAPHAEAILLQKSFEGSRQALTDEDGFNFYGAYGPSIAADDQSLFVYDAGNERILGFSVASGQIDSLNHGAPADIVLGQADFYDVNERPGNYQTFDIVLALALDPEQRLYVLDYNDGEPTVWVFNDPFTDDRLPDAQLQNLPAEAHAIRMVGDGRLMVVGIDAVRFYLRGGTEPLANPVFSSPCNTSRIWDVVDADGTFLTSCLDTIPAPECIGSAASGALCYGIYASRATAARPTTYDDHRVAYLGASSGASVYPFFPWRLAYAQNKLFVADGPDGGYHRVLLFVGVGTHLDALYASGVAPQGPTDANTGVFGQGDKTSVTPNGGNTNITASGFNGAFDIALGVANESFWVSDYHNHRVMRFDGWVNFGANASGYNAADVLGQASDIVVQPNRLEGNSMISGGGLAVDSTGALWAADRGGHRLLVFNDVANAENGSAANRVIGQHNDYTAIPNAINTSATHPQNLENPTHVAADPVLGHIYVSDTGNHRILRFPSSSATEPDRVIGSDALDSPWQDSFHCYQFGAMAVRNGHLFVAAGVYGGGGVCGSTSEEPANRVLYYDTTVNDLNIPGTPTRVIGQGETEDPKAAGNVANYGLGNPAADNFFSVKALALDSVGTLYVADAGNARVLRFDAPTEDTPDARIADGVLGQVGFIAQDYDSASTAGPKSIEFPVGLATTPQDGLWVLDASNMRALLFEDPKTIDPEAGMPLPSMVLGQGGFYNNDPYGGADGYNGRGFSINANALATDPSGRNVFIMEGLPTRILRFFINRPPRVSLRTEPASGTRFEVVEGSELGLVIEANDDDGDDMTYTLEPADGPATVLGEVVLVSAADLRAGARVDATLVVTDDAATPAITRLPFTVHVVRDERGVDGGSVLPSPPAPRTPTEVDTGCTCAGGGIALPWFVALVFLWRRRRRKA